MKCLMQAVDDRHKPMTLHAETKWEFVCGGIGIAETVDMLCTRQAHVAAYELRTLSGDLIRRIRHNGPLPLVQKGFYLRLTPGRVCITFDNEGQS